MGHIKLRSNVFLNDTTYTIPAAISGGKANTVAREKPTIGIMVNWRTRPIPIVFDILITPTKSLKLIAVLIPNMINCNRGTISSFKPKDPHLAKA